MFQICPICKGSGNAGIHQILCSICLGKKIINEFTGKPPKDLESTNKEEYMKKVIAIVLGIMCLSPIAYAKEFKQFNIYTDAHDRDNHYIPSGWMGDYGDIKFNDKSPVAHSGKTAIHIIYSNATSQGARWSGIYWQNPANNWGIRQGGYDLTGAKKLTFWARGEKGGEVIEEFKIGGITGEFADSDVAGIGPVTLTREWKEYTIDLKSKDLSSISGGFCWATNLDSNPDGVDFYLDDIKYE